jgi:hypothetical protein
MRRDKASRRKRPLKKGMEEKSREFTEKGSELYAKRDFQVFFPATQALEKFLKKST